jgi:hypothetical protein
MPQSYSYAYPSGYDRSGRHRCHCPIFPVPGGLRASAPYPSSSASDRSEGSPFPIPHERGIRLATTYDVSPFTPLPIVERDAHSHHSTLRAKLIVLGAKTGPRLLAPFGASVVGDVVAKAECPVMTIGSV